MTGINTHSLSAQRNIESPDQLNDDAALASRIDQVAAPPPPTPGAAASLRNANGAPQLAKPTMDPANLDKVLMELKSLLAGEQIKQSKQEVEANRSERKARYEEAAKKLEQAIDKLKDVEKLKKFADLASLASKVLGVVATVAGLIGGAAATIGAAMSIVSALSGGTALGFQGFVLAIGLVGLGIAALSTAAAVGLQVSDSTGLTDKALDAAIDSYLDLTSKDMSEQERAITKLAIKLAFQAVIIFVGFVGSAMSLGLGAGAATANLTKAASAGAKALAQVVKVIGSIVKAVNALAQVTAGAAKTMQGGVQFFEGSTIDILQAVKKYEAENEKADAEAVKVLIQKLTALIEEEAERIQEILEQHNESVSRVIANMRAKGETDTIISRQMV